MVGAFGEVQVMDWGLAKVLSASPPAGAEPRSALGSTVIHTPRELDAAATQVGSVLGTPAYMSPEQAAGEIYCVDRRSDVFSLGALLCVILTGKPPYLGRSMEAVRLAAVRGQLDNAFARIEASDAESELKALARRCLAFEPDGRPADGSAVAAEVAALRADAERRAREAEIERVRAEVQAAELKKRRKVQTALAASVLTMLLLLGVGGWWFDRASERRRADELHERQAIAAALDRAELALKRDNPVYLEIDGALGEAQRRLTGGSGADLESRWHSLRDDRQLLGRLDDIGKRHGISGRGTTTSLPRYIDERYATALKDYGIDVAADPTQALAVRVRQSLVAARLLMALEDWLAFSDNERLLELVNALDADVERCALRQAYASKQQRAITAALARLQGSDLVPAFAAYVGNHPLTPYGEAVRILKAATAAHPSDFNLAMALADQYYDRAPDRAVAYYRVAIALRPTDMLAHFYLADVLRKSDLPAAIAAYREAIRLDPNDAGPRDGLGRALYGTKHVEAAESEFLQSIRLDPDYPWPHNGMGHILLDRGDIADAIAKFKEAIRLSKKLPAHTDFAQLYTDLGSVYNRKEDWDRAIPEYKTAIAINPDSFDSHRGLAKALAGRGDVAEALQRLRVKIAKLHPQWLIDVTTRFQYDMACLAVLLSDETDTVPPAQRAAVRQEALGWLQASLAAWRLKLADADLRQTVHDEMVHWLEDEELGAVRDQEMIKSLPGDERRRWEQFWADVQRLRDEAGAEVLPMPRVRGKM